MAVASPPVSAEEGQRAEGIAVPKVSRVLSGLSTLTLACASVAAPVAVPLVTLLVFAGAFALPWFAALTDLGQLMAAVTPFCVGGFYAAGALRGGRPGWRVPKLALLTAPLVASTALVASLHEVSALPALLYSLLLGVPFILAGVPMLFPGARSLPINLLVGGAAAVAAAALLVLAVLLASTIGGSDQGGARDDDPLALDRAEGTNQYHVLEGSMFAAGVAIAAVYVAYIAVAHLHGALGARRGRPQAPSAPDHAALLDDLYVRGIVEPHEHAEFARRAESLRSGWARVTDRLQRTLAPAQQSRTLLIFGLVLAATTLLVLALVAGGLATCAGSAHCWSAAQEAAFILTMGTFVGGFALGVSVASVCSGVLGLRAVADEERAANQEFQRLTVEGHGAKQAILELGRSRHSAPREPSTPPSPE